MLSETAKYALQVPSLFVLILVLVEHALGARTNKADKAATVVLILVLVEHALGDLILHLLLHLLLRLNPCFSGTCSRSKNE